MSTPLLHLTSLRRWLWPAGWLLCAAWAAAFPLLSPLGPHRTWGAVAAAGYLLAAALSGLVRRRNGQLASAAVAFGVCAVLPLALALRAGTGQSEVAVIGRAGERLLAQGSPYLEAPSAVADLTPYLPGMAAFGLPRALLGADAALGDPRLWCAAAFLAAAGGGWRLLRRPDDRPGPPSHDRLREPRARRSATALTTAATGPLTAWHEVPHRPTGPRARRSTTALPANATDRPATRYGLRAGRPAAGSPTLAGVVALAASPVVALPLAVSGVDLPMTGLLCLALALAGRGRGAGAGLALAAACALKWTAWPAVPVAVALLAAVAGRRAARRCAGVAVAGAGALVLPWLLIAPGPMVRQVFAFPLGLGAWRTPAASPLPGRLLAQLGPGGWWPALVALLLGGCAVALSLVLRPPVGAVAAADRLAIGLALAFLLAPAGRFGYLALPVFLAVFMRLAGPPPHAAGLTTAPPTAEAATTATGPCPAAHPRSRPRPSRTAARKHGPPSPDAPDAVLPHRTGTVVEGRALPALADVVASYSEGPSGAAEFGGAGRARVEQQWSWDASAARQNARLAGDGAAPPERLPTEPRPR
ncbi:glycosyltransferase [Kitasatospora sp. NPDC059646]|uniref:glycosyltransferase n=1 Tax=Kitasatospora sp. NPDC059646 TaxID=3346893 RepID=UPI0036B2C53B